MMDARDIILLCPAEDLDTGKWIWLPCYYWIICFDYFHTYCKVWNDIFSMQNCWASGHFVKFGDRSTGHWSSGSEFDVFEWLCIGPVWEARMLQVCAEIFRSFQIGRYVRTFESVTLLTPMNSCERCCRCFHLSELVPSPEVLCCMTVAGRGFISKPTVSKPRYKVPA